jgi:hypothetical protein
MMRPYPLLGIFLLCCISLSCRKSGDGSSPNGKVYEYGFTSGTEGWTGGFADYPNEPNVEQTYLLEFSHSFLPAPLNPSDGALKQSGINRSDDLFMFIKRKISGLEPMKTYMVSITVNIASNAANNMIGIGGSPGESVWIKAGAVTSEPVNVLNTSDNHYRMNIDQGIQSNSGADMKVIGNFANGTAINEYKLKTMATTSSLAVKANAQGEIWLVVGTDSGFEGKTTIYYNSIQAVIR